ncbi:unnamed protein product [Pieris macdunnoughi]|uniref:Uncharacterized protein n=1 Tax=Pieris macdunnoughi TaxID=345717 RepID=A0A821QJH6_9NEOP|nr:unnamed protein product [Pieris macdunnoughi]
MAMAKVSEVEQKRQSLIDCMKVYLIVPGWWWVGACIGGAVLLCAAGALAHPLLRRRLAGNTSTTANPTACTCGGARKTRSMRVCAATSGQPVHPRRPPVRPATRLRTPRRAAVASASLNNKTRSMAAVLLPI